MWMDNASDIDMLFYEPYAKMISSIAKNKKYNPITIGVFGLWGAGKSTLLNLIESNIENNKDKSKTICVSINAWMFEGYEDAKVALMEALLNELDAEEHNSFFSAVKKDIKSLLKRINYFKLGSDIVKKSIPVVASVATGSPIPLLLSIPTDKDGIETAIQSVSSGMRTFKESYVEDKKDSTVENIRKFRTDFEQMIKNSEVDNIVVLVDDLDRCTPERIIESLEAIKLFLSVEGTTFIIAADETVIEYAIEKKYPKLEGSQVVLSSEYIEKIIQLPITIPDLSAKDIENYFLLLVSQMYLKKDAFQKLIMKISDNKIAVRETEITLQELNQMISELGDDVFELSTEEYKNDSETIDAVKDIIATNLKGNPRQTKRFLNTFLTKKELAQMYFGDDIDLKIMAKILVLQKISPDLFLQLNQWNKEYITSNEGLKEIYDNVIEKHSVDEKYSQWRTPQLMKWLQCEPIEIYKQRLDKYFYLTREKIKESSNSFGELLPETRKALEKIGNATEANIESIINELNMADPQVTDETIQIVLKQYNQAKLELFVVRYIFDKCISYRGKVVEALRKRSQKYDLQDVPYLKSMLNIDQGLIMPFLDSVRGNSLSNPLYDKITKKKEK